MKKELVIILGLLLISIPAVRALLQQGGYTSHDLTHHVVRQIDMNRLLSEGQFPPRWSGELASGYGYPLFIFMPVILAFVVVLKLLNTKRERPAFLRNISLMFLLGLGLAAFFWLPAIFEKQYIRYDLLMRRIYLDQFPSLGQIIYSVWGYGLSHPKFPEGGMSYQVGLAHIAAMIILLSQLWRLRQVKTFLLLGILTVLSFAVSIFFMLEISLPFWDNLPFLSYIQFPVRLLIVPVFSASLTAALLVKYSPFRKVIFLGLLILVLYANRNHLGINQKYDPGEEYYKSLQTTATSFDEDLPIWVTKMRTDPSYSKFTFLSSQGAIKELKTTSAKVLAEIESTSAATLRFNQYYFPGWEIKVNGKKTDINYSTEDSGGLPVFGLPKGKHLVLAEFKNTTVRNIADITSLISVILWLALLCNWLRGLTRQVSFW